MKEEQESVDIVYYAKPGSKHTRGKWSVTRGEVPPGGVFIGTLAGGYTIWSNAIEEGDPEATAILASTAPLLLSAIETFLTMLETWPSLMAKSNESLLKAGLDDTQIRETARMGRIKLRAAVEHAYRKVEDDK